MVDKADLCTPLHSPAEETLFEKNVRRRWPGSNVVVEKKVVGSSS